MGEERLELDAAPGIHRIEDANVNWYLIEAEDGMTIVEAGVPRSWDSLREALGELSRDQASRASRFPPGTVDPAFARTFGQVLTRERSVFHLFDPRVVGGLLLPGANPSEAA
jgi:hypothetical protein